MCWRLGPQLVVVFWEVLKKIRRWSLTRGLTGGRSLGVSFPWTISVSCFLLPDHNEDSYSENNEN
jgi:hypothetical protein